MLFREERATFFRCHLSTKYLVVPVQRSKMRTDVSFCLCPRADTRRRRRRDRPHAAETPSDVRLAQGSRGREHHGSAPSSSVGQSWQAYRPGHERQRMRHKGIYLCDADEHISPLPFWARNRVYVPAHYWSRPTQVAAKISDTTNRSFHVWRKIVAARTQLMPYDWQLTFDIRRRKTSNGVCFCSYWRLILLLNIPTAHQHALNINSGCL